jgi:hypothetical protein
MPEDKTCQLRSTVRKAHIAHLSSCSLAYKACCLSLSRAIGSETEALDVGMGCCTVVAGISLDFADLNHPVDCEQAGLSSSTY